MTRVSLDDDAIRERYGLALTPRVFAPSPGSGSVKLCDCPQLPPDRDPRYEEYLRAGIMTAVRRRLAIDAEIRAHRPR